MAIVHNLEELSENPICVWGIASSSDLNLTLFERGLKLKCEIQLRVWGIASSSDLNVTLFERDLKLKCEIQLCVCGA